MNLIDRFRSQVDDPNPVVRAHARARLAAIGDEKSSPEHPSLARQAVSFGKAVVSHVADGMAKASDEEQARRLAICEGCPEFVAAERRCKQCGCYMDVKARWQSGSCPIGKW